ncbi:MAG: M23 family metallopeptidase [Gammaproteobacteria bacterium]|nr:M23 family metallopeptidase [Gammaproteobacteria bacterium]
MNFNTIKTKRLNFLFLGMILICSSLANSNPINIKTNCKIEPDICYRTEESETTIDLYIINKSLTIITLDLDFHANNLEKIYLQKSTDTIEKKSEKLIARYAIGNTSSWSYSFKYFSQPGDFNSSHNDSHTYQLPFKKDTEFTLTQSFNGEFSHVTEHNQYALDFAMPIGTEILAARSGKVIKVISHYTTSGTTLDYLDKANKVMIEHDDGTIAAYVHLKYLGSYVLPGDLIKVGDIIGLSGNTGYSTGPHLHFSIQSPITGKKSQSFPFVFETSNGVISDPIAGLKYKSANIPIINEAENSNQTESDINQISSGSASGGSSGGSMNFLFSIALLLLIRKRKNSSIFIFHILHIK